jgi:thymidine kinase
MTARLELLLGCMWSGKSSELLRRVRRHRIASNRVLLINHVSDTRYSAGAAAVTHTQDCEPAVCVDSEGLRTLDCAAYDVVAIDEAHFYESGALFAAVSALLDAKKHVIVSALDGDFLRRPFDSIPPLLPLCDSVVKLTAICVRCKSAEAVHTLKMEHNASTDTVCVVGGSELYQPCCRSCWEAAMSYINSAT